MRDKLKEYFLKYQVTGVEFDSRTVKAGDAFFAIKGEKGDGNLHTNEARDKGAVVIFTDDKNRQAKDVIYVEDARLAVAEAASIIYPKIPDKLIAVTGTNGKTSVVSYCQQLLKLLRIKSAAIGTIGIIAGEETKSKLSINTEDTLTTADPITFRKMLHELTEAGIEAVAFEASSHGIEQKRMGSLKVDSAGFTSFSQDHLDYHGSMENYLAAKLGLFSNHLKKNGKVVANLQNPWKQDIIDYFKQHKIDFVQVGDDVGVNIDSVIQSIDGQKVAFTRHSTQYNFQTNIIGSFQASNLLIAAELVANIGFNYKEIIANIPAVNAVVGRLQRITNKEQYHVFVDYAHTPDSLEKSLQELSALKLRKGRLIVVFGCGGDRDKTKRPMMGEIASKIADIAIITDDNPRSEDAAVIRAEIIASAPDAIEIPDRKMAIERGIDLLQKDDILLIAGKGHENYQIIGSKKMPFSDIGISTNIIQKRVI